MDRESPPPSALRPHLALLRRPVLERCGHEGLHGHISQLDLDAALPRKDRHLVRVEIGRVSTSVGTSVSVRTISISTRTIFSSGRSTTSISVSVSVSISISVSVSISSSALRATSVPERSSRGSGSVKPLPLASVITSENAMPARTAQGHVCMHSARCAVRGVQCAVCSARARGSAMRPQCACSA